MTKLSPAAQAALDAAANAYFDWNDGSPAADMAAAALRAAAQKIGKRKTLKVLGVAMAQSPAYCLVSDLLAIADELEAQ